MPIEVGIWRIDGAPARVPFSALETEKKLEDALHTDLGILDPGLLLLGRQVPTAHGKFIDLLAVDAAGELVVAELKRGRTPRDVVAQLLDYGSWVQTLGVGELASIYANQHPGDTLASAYAARFGGPLPEDLNAAHRLTVVASGLDAETERIIAYLSDTFGVPINALFFRYFRVGNAEFLARTWLIDPAEAEVRSERAPSSPRVQGKWNGRDYFVNVGEGSPNRAWEDARRYGFVAAGQSRWASSRLGLLAPGNRVFACISRLGYVGVGEVTGTVMPVRDFRVPGPDGAPRPLLDAPLTAPEMDANADDSDLCEYVVPIRWLDARPAAQAYWESGMFANQNPACRLRDEGTLQKLVLGDTVSWLCAAFGDRLSLSGRGRLRVLRHQSGVVCRIRRRSAHPPPSCTSSSSP